MNADRVLFNPAFWGAVVIIVALIIALVIEYNRTRFAIECIRDLHGEVLIFAERMWCVSPEGVISGGKAY